MGNDVDRVGGPRPRRAFPLRYYLIALVLSAVVPVLAVGAFAVLRAGSTLRQASTDLLMNSARTMAAAIERELEGSTTQLATRGLAGAAVDVPAPVPSGMALSEVRRSGRPVVSHLFHAPDSGEPLIAIVTPAAPDSSEHFPVIAVPPQSLIQALPREDTRLSGVLVAVTDGEGYIVARSVDPARFVGTRARDWEALLATGTDHGTFDARTRDGTRIYFAFSRLRNTPGWTVVVGEPRERFDARWQQPLQSLLVASAVSLVLVLLGSGWVAGLVLRPIRALADNGRRVAAAGDQPVAPAPEVNSAIYEFEDLRLSLSDAHQALLQRAEAERETARELAYSERRYRALAEIGALVFWRRLPDGRVLSAAGWTELTGRPEDEATGQGWIDRVHPDDRESTEQAWQAAVAGVHHGVIDVEFRVQAASGRWHWVRARGAPIREEGATLEWAGVLEDVDERRRTQAHIAHMAHHDVLTGLPNRLLFAERLREAINLPAAAGQVRVAVLCIDLDRFKQVNDTLGHPAGDRVLQAVAGRLAGNLREGDTVARLGGDEFAIIQTHGEQPAAATTLAARIIATLAEPFEVDGTHVLIGASVGIALPAHDVSHPDELMQQADRALYQAKQLGRGQFRFFG